MSSFTRMVTSPSFPRTLAVSLISALEILFFVLLLFSMRHLMQPARIDQQLTEVAANLVAEKANKTINGQGNGNQNQPISRTSLSSAKPETNTSGEELAMALSKIFEPLPQTVASSRYQTTKELTDLGRSLFFDPRLSLSQTLSCHSCHLLASYGVDNLARSIGHNERLTDRNAPSVYNSALHVTQFWDGRSPDVEDQAIEPILKTSEMSMLEPERVSERLQSITGYVQMFRDAFPNDSEPINITNVGIAIGAFERGLLTPARFDRFLAGDYSQLNEQEQRGLSTFVSLRCATCHFGVALGGSSYKRLGEQEPYPMQDLGRYNVTGLDQDKNVFKVPSLRNVAKTAPYLHDGSISTLTEMVQIMIRYQLGKQASEAEVMDIVAFLNTLTGELPTDYIAEPELPGMPVTMPLSPQAIKR